jgi:phospholipid-binding lipoprotein MlaA
MPDARLTSLRRLRSLTVALMMGLSLAACATRPDPSDAQATAEYWERNDPLETLNRGTFFVNQAADTMFIRPAAELYRYLIPAPVRQVVRNGLANLREPVTFGNDLLQGNVGRAGDTAARFAINTTLGVAGLFDVATDFGFPRQREGFGDTLAVWGIDSGPYLVLPILGPSNFRDTIGFAVDWFSDPWSYIASNNGARDVVAPRTALEVLDLRENLIETIDQVQRTSLDPYATLRSAYRQRRDAEIENRVQPFSAQPVTRIENR